jgi:hypothetical protein
VEELRLDLRAVVQRCRPDRDKLDFLEALCLTSCDVLGSRFTEAHGVIVVAAARGRSDR